MGKGALSVARNYSATLEGQEQANIVPKISERVAKVHVQVGTAVPADRLIVTLDKSGARIVFTDGCSVTLEENQIFVIDARLGCKALPIASSPAPAAVGGLTTAQALLIGVTVVGGAALIGNANSQDNRPISRQ